MAGLNKLFLMGRLVADPEPAGYIGKDGSEHTVADFKLAVNEGYGERETVAYFSCTAFEKTADYMLAYGRKASRVFVEGRLRQDRWVDKKTKSNMQRLSVVADRVEVLDKLEPNAAGNRQPQATQQPQQAPQTGYGNNYRPNY